MSGPARTGPLHEARRCTDRRRFLASAGAVGTALVAGCLGDDGDTDNGEATDDDGESPDDAGESPDDDGESPDDDGDTDGGGIDDDPATLERRAREYMQLSGDGLFEAASERFAGSVAEQVSAADLEAGWEQVVQASGAFESILETEFQTVTDGVAVVRVETAHTLVKNTWRVSLNDQGILGSETTGQEPYEWDPPAYADQSAFEETEVALDAPGSCELGGTLSVPTGEESVPGAVIVHGSGPVDRDGTYGSNKPYKELAWGLASRGVAVLRYDKRTNACDVALSDLTVDDATTDDALTALERLRAHDRVAADSVFLVGHSLGGALAPRIADRDGALAGAVMLAPGPARPFADVILDQQEHLLDQRDLGETEREQIMADVREDAEKVRSLDIADDEVLFGLGGREYFRTLTEYNGPETAAALDIPLFLAQGGRDYQVTPDEDFPIWQEALAGMPNVSLERYDDLNHLFQESEGPMTNTEYYDPAAVLDERLVDAVATFVDSNS
jgi:dienelactone hydrolase